ncbi:WD40 repeat domain-containing protein [Prosthecobacter fusiformis]|uniref:WD40 repeat domain-containing protein n=1 Tax=Prosthecobacter fusiformis TaxID=48464 RepID=UPI00105D1336|nr:WD40 repeat domain-containing protein [Prosthecobacter fusiformis]
MSAQNQDVPEPPAEWKVEFQPRTASALLGHLGEPEIGSPMNTRDLRMVWHESGRLFFSNTGIHIPPSEQIIQVWSYPTATSPAKCKGSLNVGGSWSLSAAGDRLCAQAYAPAEKYHYDKNEFHAVSCFRFPEGVRIWKCAFDTGNYARLVATCFSKDDKRVLAATYNEGLSTLHLLNAETGAEESRLVVSNHQERRCSESCLVALGDEFALIMQSESQGAKIFQVRLNPLRLDPAPFENLSLGDLHRLVRSKDERYLAVSSSDSYEILEAKRGMWESCLDGRAQGVWSGNGRFLNPMVFSPDSRFLFVSTSAEAKVIDIAARKVIKDELGGAEGAVYSPDGSVILVAEHSGIGVWNTRDWSYRPSIESQHDCPVSGVNFLPDGKTLISRDHNGLIVWDLPTRRARASLKSSRTQAQFGAFVLVNGMRDIIASDGWDYLRWPMPSLQGPPPAKPVKKLGVPAFGTVLSQAESCTHQSIFADKTGRQLITVSSGSVHLRDVSAPGTVKTLSSLENTRFSDYEHLVFLDEQNICLHNSEGEIFHVNLKTDQLTELTEMKDASYKGLWIPGRRWYATLGKAGVQFINAGTGAVAQTLRKMKGNVDFSHTYIQGAFGAAVTKNEKMVAAFMSDRLHGINYVSLWDLDSAQMLALQMLPGMSMNCLDFSPDGKTLAVGHGNTAISLWDVDKMIAAAPPPAEIPVVASSAPRVRPKVAQAEEEPSGPVPDAEGHLWTFRPDGSCAVESRLPSFGKLKVNGKPFVSQRVSYFKAEKELIRSPFALDHFGVIEGEGVWVSRHLGVHAMFMMAENILHAVDSFTNVTDKAVKTEISFEIEYPADAKGLLTTPDAPLTIPQDGRFSLGKDDLWIAASGSGKVGETLAAVRVQTIVKKQSPQVQWDAMSKKLLVTYTAEIPPGETRWLAHGVSLVRRYTEGGIDAVTGFPSHAEVGYHVPPGNDAQILNFGRPDLGSPDHVKLPQFSSTMDEENSDSKTKRDLDGLGFTWAEQHDKGRYGEMGATSVYQIWFEGRPARMRLPDSLLQPHYNGKLVMRSAIVLHDPMSPVMVQRQDHNLEGGAATVWQDKFYNPDAEARTVRMSYVTTFRSPVVAVWDANGQKRPLADLKDTASGLGGACAFVLEGAEQPATLLAFHREGAAISAKMRWLGPQAIALDYEFVIEAKTTVNLLHGACQRPLTAFGGADSAFSDWLPLKLKPSVAQPGQTSVQPIMLLNYIVSPSP